MIVYKFNVFTTQEMDTGESLFMLSQKLSAEVFKENEGNPEELNKILESLRMIILSEIQDVAETKFKEIVERLNDLGHDLKPYGEQYQDMCDLAYRDDFEDVSGYHCKLRIGFAGIVSTVYNNL